jgi:subfamily B ATP-binding cassette protein HlyB/CyaB
VIATIPIYLLISLAVTPVLKRRLDEKAARSMENQAFLVELIGGVETLKAMAVEPRMRRRWEEQLAGYTAAAFHASDLAGAAGHAVNLVSKVSTVALLWIGARAVIDGDLTVGQLIAFNMLAARVASPILRLSQLWQDFQQMRVSITRLGDIMNNQAETSSLEAHSNPPTIEGRITLDHTTFRYRPDGPAVLEDVSLEIAPGEVIGIVGWCSACRCPSAAVCWSTVSTWHWSTRPGCVARWASSCRTPCCSTARCARTLRWPIRRWR